MREPWEEVLRSRPVQTGTSSSSALTAMVSLGYMKIGVLLQRQNAAGTFISGRKLLGGYLTQGVGGEN